eukprot:UN05916
MFLFLRSVFTVSYRRRLGLPLPRLPPSGSKHSTSSRTVSGLRRACPNQRRRSCNSLLRRPFDTQPLGGCLVRKIMVVLELQDSFYR